MADMDPYIFSDNTGDDSDLDGNGLSFGGSGGETGAVDATNLVDRLAESAISGAMFERKGAARGLLEAFRQTYLSEEDLASVIDVIDKLVDDQEQSVRTEVMEQLPQIALFCHEEGPYLDYVVPQHILPHIVKLLTDKFTQVRKTSQAGLLLLVEQGIIAPSQVEENVCPVILEYTGPPAHEDYRTEIAQFMSKLAPLVGKDITVKSYLDRFCNLCRDSLFQVRRVCASSMGEIAAVIGTNLTEKILVPHFLALCNDEVWGVRKGCAEIYTSVSSVCRLSTRKNILTPAFLCLLQDPSRWVRVAACQTLGPFITTFLSDESPPSAPQYSEIEKNFLIGNGSVHQLCGDFESGNNNDDEYDRQDRGNRSNYSSVISSCPEKKSIKDFPVPIVKGNSQPLEDQGTITSSEIVEQQPPIKLYSVDNVSAEPMEIDETEEQSEKSKSRLACSASGDMNSSSGFEIPLQISREKEGTLGEIGQENRKQIVSSNLSSAALDHEDQHDSSGKYNENPRVSISSSESDSVYHIHVEKDNLTELGSITRSASEVSGQQSSGGGTGDSTNKSDFNTWQYWRLPIPDIELDIDMHEGAKTADVHLQATAHDLQQRNLHCSERNDKVELDKLISHEHHSIQNMETESEELKDSEFEISTASSSLVFENSYKSITLDSSTSKTTVSVVDGRVSDVHRSYMNLYNATRDQGFEDAGFESLKLGDNCYDDDSDEQLSSSFPFGDEYAGHDIWASKTTRGKILIDLPKPSLNSQEIVPEDLLEHFTSMCMPNKEHHTIDLEIASFCVYNLPAVVLTLGPQNWSLVRDCYEALACSMQWKIRYTLAASLHEIASILGPELAERDLFPYYNSITKDLDEVRIGILRNLANFIKILGSEARKKCLETLKCFLYTENSRNWRFRLELADQIQRLSEMFDADEVYKHLCPISMDLIQDRVSEVRKKALSVVPYLVTRLNYAYPNGSSRDSSVVREFLLQLVKTLGHSEQWVKRQAFADLAGQLVEIGAMSPTQFAHDILPHLINLSEDKVPNVRLVVAQSLSCSIIQLDYFADPANPHNEILTNTLSKLQQDEDQDVRFYSQLQDEDND